jgi:uroporphyrinogen decarboxylase
MEEGKRWDADFGFDAGIEIVDVNLGYFPAFEYKVLEEKSDTLIIRDGYGIVQEIRKHGSSIPRFIDYPVKNPEDWEKLKRERLDSNDPGRFPGNWKGLVKKYNEGDKLVQLGVFPFGLFGTLRDMMGVEELLVSFYEQPELIHDMMDYLTDFWITIYEKVCMEVKVDAIHIWEDMSGKTGSLISPKMVREFMMPNYKRIKAFADSHGIPVLSLDTDGDCSELVPLYIESGINLVFPFEVAAGCDITEYRKKYPNLCIMGGIDKQEIAKGKSAIDRELDRIDVMFAQSGYIPALDHLIPPEISWEDFNYFIKQLKKKIGISGG